MNVACGVLKKFDIFITNCYSHLNVVTGENTPNIILLQVRNYKKKKRNRFYINYYFRKLMIPK